MLKETQFHICKYCHLGKSKLAQHIKDQHEVNEQNSNKHTLEKEASLRNYKMKRTDP